MKRELGRKRKLEEDHTWRGKGGGEGGGEIAEWLGWQWRSIIAGDLVHLLCRLYCASTMT